MRHQRQGWWRLVALPVALLGALVVAPTISAAGPNTFGNTVLGFSDCDAHVVVDWAGQPGRLRTYTVEIWSDFGTGVTQLGAGDLARSGHLEFFPSYVATLEFSNTFHAVTHVFDGKGVEQATWTSGDVAVGCV
jgi:hypothetical protein